MHNLNRHCSIGLVRDRINPVEDKVKEIVDSFYPSDPDHFEEVYHRTHFSNCSPIGESGYQAKQIWNQKTFGISLDMVWDNCSNSSLAVVKGVLFNVFIVLGNQANQEVYQQKEVHKNVNEIDTFISNESHSDVQRENYEGSDGHYGDENFEALQHY